MPAKSERAQIMQEMIDTAGWQEVSQYLEGQEKRIMDATTKNIMSLKASEFAKWQPYYAGELSMITHLKKFVDDAIREPKTKRLDILTKKYQELFND